MAEQIKDGTGTGALVKIDSSHRMATAALSMTQIQEALGRCKTWNLGSGDLTLTSANASALLYLKNTGTKSLFIDLYVFLANASTGGSGLAEIEILRNPTAGTVVSDATAITATNMNFNCVDQPIADMYSGGEGKTLTGEDDILRSQMTSSDRLLLGILTELPTGASVGLRVTPPPGNTSMAIEAIMEIYEQA